MTSGPEDDPTYSPGHGWARILSRLKTLLETGRHSSALYEWGGPEIFRRQITQCSKFPLPGAFVVKRSRGIHGLIRTHSRYRWRVTRSGADRMHEARLNGAGAW